MGRQANTKSALHRERKALERYRRFLPSLDLKRQQLMAELAAARRDLKVHRAETDRRQADTGRQLPMLANPEFDLSGLVAITRIDTATENHLGVRMPHLIAVHFRRRPYPMIGKPHWFDRAVIALEDIARRRVAERIMDARATALAEAVRRVTQRVNLFDKVLIPRAEATIARIRIVLADAERAAVVRSKVAKAKHAAHALAAGRTDGVQERPA